MGHDDRGRAERVVQPTGRSARARRLCLLHVRGEGPSFKGTPDEVRAGKLPSLRQFVYGESDGPVPFHYRRRNSAGSPGAMTARIVELLRALGARIVNKLGLRLGFACRFLWLTLKESGRVCVASILRFAKSTSRGCCRSSSSSCRGFSLGGSGAAGLRHARAVRFLGGARSACEPVVGA